MRLTIRDGSGNRISKTDRIKKALRYAARNDWRFGPEVPRDVRGLSQRKVGIGMTPTVAILITAAFCGLCVVAGLIGYHAACSFREHARKRAHLKRLAREAATETWRMPKRVLNTCQPPVDWLDGVYGNPPYTHCRPPEKDCELRSHEERRVHEHGNEEGM